MGGYYTVIQLMISNRVCHMAGIACIFYDLGTIETHDAGYIYVHIYVYMLQTG